MQQRPAAALVYANRQGRRTARQTGLAARWGGGRDPVTRDKEVGMVEWR